MVVYQSKDGGLELGARIEKDSVWLNQSQIADLFSIDRSVITKHLSNIFKTQELKEVSNVQKMHVAGADRHVKFYSLDVIISVGYRVNSKKATQFRIWATKVLKNHLLQGYTVRKFVDLNKVGYWLWRIRKNFFSFTNQDLNPQPLSARQSYSRNQPLVYPKSSVVIGGVGSEPSPRGK